MYICIYAYRERERERERYSMYLYIYLHDGFPVSFGTDPATRVSRSANIAGRRELTCSEFVELVF